MVSSRPTVDFDETYIRPSYDSGTVFSDHVPRQHGTPFNNGGPVATPGSDRNGGYQQMPPVYGAYPGYQPPVPYWQRESYTLEQQGHTNPPQQSTHGQYTPDYRNGGVAPYNASHAHGRNTHTQYAGSNGYGTGYPYGAPSYQQTTYGRAGRGYPYGAPSYQQTTYRRAGRGYPPYGAPSYQQTTHGRGYLYGGRGYPYGAPSYQQTTPGRHQFDDYEPNGYYGRRNLTATTENTKVANKLSTCQTGHQEPQRNVILVAGRQDAGGDSVEFLFQMAENMARVVGVGFNWSKVVINRQYDVSIIHVGESAWSDLWNEVRTEATPHNESNSFSLMNIEFLTTPTEQVDTLYNLTAQESSKRFGVGLEGSGLGVHVYADDNNIQSGEDFPLIFSLVEHMGFKRENAKDLGKQHSGTSSSKATSSGNNTQTSPKEEKCLPQQNQGPTKKNHGDNEDEESHHPPEDSGLQQHSQSPIDPKDTSLIVIVIPESGGTFHRGSTNDIEYPRDSIKLAAIDPRLEFKFEKLGNYRKITTTTKTRCHLGGGEPKYRELDCGYYQDNITISLNCEKEDAARLSSSEVTAIVSTKQTTVETFTDSSSLARQTGGQIGGQVQIPAVGIGFQAQGNMNVTSTIGGSSSLAESEEISNTQLAGFFVNPADRKGSQVYNFLYRTDVLRLINNPAKFISAGICRTLSLTIVGEWDALDMDDACLYNFKTERDLMSVGDLMQSFAAWKVPYMRQRYQVPFYINHAMTHIGGYGTTVLIHGPGEQRLEHVLTKYPAIA